MEMKRTKQTGQNICVPQTGSVVYPESYRQMPGHLPYPPQECPFVKHIFVDAYSGISWIDLAFCASGKCGPKPCRRRQEYSHSEWKREYLRLQSIEAKSGKARRKI